LSSFNSFQFNGEKSKGRKRKKRDKISRGLKQPGKRLYAPSQQHSKYKWPCIISYLEQLTPNLCL
jgi:hypothetical protein